MDESRHTYEWVISHIWMRHGTHKNESSHTHEWFMAHIWMSNVTYTYIYIYVYIYVYIYIYIHIHVWMKMHVPCLFSKASFKNSPWKIFPEKKIPMEIFPWNIFAQNIHSHFRKRDVERETENWRAYVHHSIGKRSWCRNRHRQRCGWRYKWIDGYMDRNIHRHINACSHTS